MYIKMSHVHILGQAWRKYSTYMLREIQYFKKRFKHVLRKASISRTSPIQTETQKYSEKRNILGSKNNGSESLTEV